MLSGVTPRCLMASQAALQVMPYLQPAHAAAGQPISILTAWELPAAGPRRMAACWWIWLVGAGGLCQLGSAFRLMRVGEIWGEFRGALGVGDWERL